MEEKRAQYSEDEIITLEFDNGESFENKGLCRLTQVGVQKKNLAVLLCQRKGNICGNGGFAFVFAAACNQKELSVLLVMCPFYKDTKLMDGFRVIKAAGWVGNQQGFFPAL